MKKLNAKGFTLIELLAVITIMGILLLVAIPTVSRTIENSRKDTFIDTVGQYVNGAKNMWAADNLSCGSYPSSAVENGTYYIGVNTENSGNVPVLLEQGGKSSWGSRHIKGYILVHVEADGDTRKVTYYPVLVDGVHGVNVKADGTPFDALPSGSTAGLVASDKLVRGSLVMTGASYAKVVSGSGTEEAVIAPKNLNANVDGTFSNATVCVEA